MQTVFYSVFYKLAENGVRRLGARLELGVKLHADIKVVCGNFNRLYKRSVWRSTRNFHTRFFNVGSEFVVKLVSVAVDTRRGALCRPSLRRVGRALSQ